MLSLGRLTPRMRLLLGAVTTVVFLGAGASVWGGGSPVGGGILVALGLYRGLAWVRELRWVLSDDEDDDDGDEGVSR